MPITDEYIEEVVELVKKVTSLIRDLQVQDEILEEAIITQQAIRKTLVEVLRDIAYNENISPKEKEEKILKLAKLIEDENPESEVDFSEKWKIMLKL